MAACRWCKQEMGEAVTCTGNTHVDFPGGEQLPAKPYGVERPPVFGVPLDVDLNHWAVPEWYYADTEPKGDLVRVFILQERRRVAGMPKPHHASRDMAHLYTYYPWETRVEAETRRDALVAEHGYHTGQIDVGDDMAAMMATGLIRIEGPHCGDCNTPVGGFHHPGCDHEKCPKCAGQLISCGCLDPEEEEEDDESEEPEEAAAVVQEPQAPNVVRLFKGDPVDLAALQEAPPPSDYIGFYDPPDSDVS